MSEEVKTPAPATAEPSKNGENGSATPEPSGGEAGPKLKEIFEAFAKFGDPKGEGKTITLSNSDKWMKQAKVFDKKLTTVDTGICFKKLK